MQLRISCHKPLEPSGETIYRIMGQLVRLDQKGVKPADYSLPHPESWTRYELRERRALVDVLSRRVEEIGTPADHPCFFRLSRRI